MMNLWPWYKTEMLLLKQYTIGWVLHYGAPGRRWLAIVLAVQGVFVAACLMLVSPFLSLRRPPVFSAWFIGRCHNYMRGSRQWWHMENHKIFSKDTMQQDV
jgi:hypothetical protein